MMNVFNTEFSTMAKPQPSWLFKVQFEFEGYKDISEEHPECLPEITPLKIDLPTMKVNTITQKYFGTMKTYPIHVDKTGETTCEFLISDTSIIYNILGLKDNKPDDKKYKRYDTNTFLKNLTIQAYDETNDINRSYILINPVITNMEHSTSLDYSSEENVKITMTIHYDDWYIEA